MSDSDETTAEIDALIDEGLARFNRGKYLEAHERWEDGWHELPARPKAFVEALIQLATALHLRTQRGATRGVEHLVARALIGLEDFRPAAYGVAVDRVIDEYGTYLDWLREVKRPHRMLDVMKIPRIRRG